MATHADEIYLCPVCGDILEFDPDYDARYCKQCDEWRDELCNRKRCEFCSKRPEKPSDRG